MKRPDNIASQSILAAIKKSAFLSTKALRARISRRSSRYSTLPVSIALSALLVGLTLFGSMFARHGSVSAFAEIIDTFASGCIVPQTTFVLGDTVCAKVLGAPQPVTVGPFTLTQRRIQWVGPDGIIAKQVNITADPQTDSIALSGAFAQIGTWTVKTVDNDNVGIAVAQFVVRDPANLAADVSIITYGPARVFAGSEVSFRVVVTNNGPDDALGVQFTNPLPNNTTFVSETQDPPLTFTCNTISGATTCSIATLPAFTRAAFTFTFLVNSGTPNNVLVANTVNVTSTTTERNTPDNDSIYETSVIGGATPCTLTCPADVTEAATSGQCGKVVTYGATTSSGTCGAVTCLPPSGSTFPVGATTVICQTENDATCNFTVTVTGNDTTPPTMTCPSNVSATDNPPGSASAAVSYSTPTATDNCTQGVQVVCNPPSGSSFSAGSTTVNCTAQDASNNSVSCSFTVTVTTNGCGLDCPDNKTVNESSAGSGSATVTYSTPTAAGTCPTLIIACSPISGSSFPVGLTTVDCTGHDAANTVFTTCSFTVTVNSLPGCAITCPANIIQSANTTCPNNNPPPSTTPCATVTYAQPTSTGTCATAPVSCNPPSGSNFPIGTTTVHCTRSDPAGNAGTCSFTVTVTGGTPCVITCPANISQASGGCGNVVTYPSPTTTGSCGDPNDPLDPNPWSCNPPSGSFFPVGTTTVTCVTDVGTQCSFNVTITGTDTVPPTIVSCAAASFAPADSCQAAVPNVTSEVVASDNCTPDNLLTVTQNPAPGTLVGTGTTTIIVTVRDASSNPSTCMTTFTVTEPIPPTAVCKNITVFLGATGSVSITGVDIDNGSSDNCVIASRTANPSTFTCANKGPNAVTLTVTDPSGNSSQCAATVTVVDSIPPAITCPANVVVFLPLNSTATSMVVNYPAVTATDNCPGVTVASIPASGSVFPVGTTTVNATATDGANNTNTCSFTVTVLYDFTGFFSPVGNLPILNTVNAGRAIPVKFSLSGNKGLSIFASGFPVSGTIACAANAPPVEVTETVTAGSSSLSYDASADQYVYTWKTEASWAGTCRQLIVRLNDGSEHVANFKFR